ncbi:type II secretion system F family protein [Myceligenerans pegani]|uniref:Type II secretion system F family protein n=1 Tax=Myceligenerans pegani TaxID=2776917 RepID=A0ABR9N0H7_9MICO|nr:type II secretion system F family protein [Myceligenerans sp. TRM 65318]MBE1877156.1 type II secretion system F family protein [Myceligenerans sp. TRM 65318]MBE3019427.1 type II secretion system F family protein [Myceligenerans sp. TRM 65318]
MNAWAVWGGTAGLGLGAGLWLVWAAWRARRPSLVERLEPYLRPRPSTSALLHDGDPGRTGPFGLFVALVALPGVAARLERLGSPADGLRRRLDRAASGESVEHFRARQLTWTVLGLAAGLGLAILLAWTRPAPGVVLGALVVLGGAAGYVTCDQALTWTVRRREERMLAEFPTIADLLALAVAAGESPAAALDRVARSTTGELSRELTRVVRAVRAGAAVPDALTAMSARTGCVPLSRFADAVAVALERGTPLAGVLQAQAQDVREAGRRALMESGGRREIAMLVPVVFLILPVTVMFAVFPSLAALRVGF